MRGNSYIFNIYTLLNEISALLHSIYNIQIDLSELTKVGTRNLAAILSMPIFLKILTVLKKYVILLTGLLRRCVYEKKHKVAFCISIITFCAGLSLIAAILTTVAPLIAIVVSTIIGAITILSACQAIESYSVIKNSNKVTSSFHEIKEAFTGEESELFIEKVFKHLCGFFSSEKESSTQR